MNLPLYPSDHSVIVDPRDEVSVVPLSSRCEVRHKLSVTLPPEVFVKLVGAVTREFPVVPAEAFVVG